MKWVGENLNLEPQHKYILLDVSMLSIAVYLYELCCILTSEGGPKYKQRVKIYSNTSHRNIY